MSHEIRTPLNAMLGLSSVLMDTELSASQRGYLQQIHAAGSVLLDVLNEILDHSKIEAGLMQIESVPLDLREIKAKCQAMFGILARQKGLALQFELASDLPLELQGDPLRVQQVLNNLVGNALKFTPRGCVTVRAECAGRNAQTVLLRISVRDTGIGLRPEQIQRLFSAFQQADDSTTRRYGGTGLGLSICKRLVELMGGEIGVESVEGQGSTFWFTLRLGVPAGQATVPLVCRVPDEDVAAAEQVPPGAALRPVDTEAVLPAVRELVRLLGTGQARSRACSAGIEQVLAGTALQQRYSPVACAVASFDFRQALEQLQQLAREQEWEVS